MAVCSLELLVCVKKASIILWKVFSLTRFTMQNFKVINLDSPFALPNNFQCAVMVEMKFNHLIKFHSFSLCNFMIIQENFDYSLFVFVTVPKMKSRSTHTRQFCLNWTFLFTSQWGAIPIFAFFSGRFWCTLTENSPSKNWFAWF